MSTEPGEPDAGPGTAAAAEAAQERDGGALQVDLDDAGDDATDSLAEDDDAAVAGPPETAKTTPQGP